MPEWEYIAWGLTFIGVGFVGGIFVCSLADWHIARKEIDELRARLRTAENTIRLLRSGLEKEREAGQWMRF